MDSTFNQVAAKLESRGAFKEVPGGGGYVRNCLFASDDDLPRFPAAQTFMVRHAVANPLFSRDDARWQNKNIGLGLDAYCPQDVFLPWLEERVCQSLRGNPDEAFIDYIAQRTTHIQNLVHTKEVGDPPRSPEISIPGYSPDKHLKHYPRILKNVVQRHPNLLIANLLIQGAGIDWLCGLVTHFSDHMPLSPIQAYMACKSITNINDTFMFHGFVNVPTLWIAVKYDGRAKGDYSQPLLKEDMDEGWKVTLKNGGMATIFQNHSGERFPVSCPMYTRLQTVADALPWQIFCFLGSDKAPAGYKGIAQSIQRSLSEERPYTPLHKEDFIYSRRLEAATDLCVRIHAECALSGAGCNLG